MTDDRLGEGSVAGASVAENLALKAIGRAPFSRGGLLNRRAINAHARELAERFEVRTTGVSTRVGSLSGGNIQRLILARELAADPWVLICGNPTAGLDARTARFVLETLRARADAGKVVVLMSSELDELLEFCDRIGVLVKGRLVAVIGRGEADRQTIGRLMVGGRAAA